MARVDIDGGVEGRELGLVGGEVGGGEVAQVDGARPVMGILVGGGAADADGGVGAYREEESLGLEGAEEVWAEELASDDDDFVFDSSRLQVSVL